MNEQAFLAVVSESRNGCNHFYSHPLVPLFNYSDGVADLAKTGCYWLLDIIATEVCALMRAHGEVYGFVIARVFNGTAVLTFEPVEGKPLWRKNIDNTDLPTGEWVFEICDEGNRIAFILITEH